MVYLFWYALFLLLCISSFVLTVYVWCKPFLGCFINYFIQIK